VPRYLCFFLLISLLTVLRGDETVTLPTMDSRLLHVPSPDWREQVIYMILTDRFADGDPSNNDLGHGEFLKGSGSHYNGGDLRGIIDKIPYLKELGVTAVWITPPVLNQWWSSPYKATGWHGYWAVDFSKVDPHMGTLEDYKDLSHALHQNGMYLIQDIVANHVGNFFTYDGNYDPEDTAKNFRLLEPESVQPVPTQDPFHMIDRLNPEHFAADIYHWTPSVQDFNSKYQEKNYMLGFLADINTENPRVIDTFKETYNWWIKEVGVDGFRIDTVMLVDHTFWEQFLNDPDGIHPFAASIGKEAFLTFGESFSISPPFETSGEAKVTSYLGSEDKPQLKAMLGFPLYASLSRVFGEGKPTAELHHRLGAFVEHFPNPHLTPTFIDNHDTRRFLSLGSRDGFTQALTALFTLPGIPILLQGTEQGLTETRQALFPGGYRSTRDYFDTTTDTFALVKQLNELRRNQPILTHGDLIPLVGDATGPGLIAYKREHKGDSIVAVFNTANHSIWSGLIEADLKPNLQLENLYTFKVDRKVTTNADGHFALELPPRSLLILGTEGATALDSAPESTQAVSISLTTDLSGTVLSKDTLIEGSVSAPGLPLKLVLDGNLESALPFTADTNGHWQTTLPVRDYGSTEHYFQIYAPEAGATSERVFYQSLVEKADLAYTVLDPAKDDHGPTGTYHSPRFYKDIGQKDILSVEATAGGHNLELSLKMRGLSQDWVPFNGMEKVAFSIFISLPDRPGSRDLPLLNAVMPDDLEWHLGHVLSGWGNSVFTNEGSGRNSRGDNLGISPQIRVDKASKTIRIIYEGNQLGVEDWKGAVIYISTWDVNGEGYYLTLSKDPSKFEMGGGEPDAPKVMDDALLRLPREATQGHLQLIPALPSAHVPARPIYVWLPDDIDPEQRLPVLYMHDGQALFNPEDSWFGGTWDIDAVASDLIKTEALPPFIIVGIWNTGLTRHSEYFPQKPWESLPLAFRQSLQQELTKERRAVYPHGKAVSDAYLKYLVDEVKPFIDAQYPTLPERKHTFVMGSSMGGLISMYALCQYPEVFAGAACLSTHWTGKWDNEDNPIPDAFLAYMEEQLPQPGRHRLYFDHGTEDLDALYGEHQQRVDALMQGKGYTRENWTTQVFAGEGHAEAAWNRRLHLPLKFLLAQP
jgi:glycosidase/enterochelin esterase-like enzyme